MMQGSNEAIKEIKPIDERFTINLSMQTPTTKHTEQQHRQALESKLQQKTQSIDSIQTAMLFPVLEDNEIKCLHDGVVKLKSSQSKSLDS